MHRSAYHALEAFLRASHAREEAIWARRLKILLAVMADDIGAVAAIEPGVTVEELLEVGRLADEMRRTGDA